MPEHYLRFQESMARDRESDSEEVPPPDEPLSEAALSALKVTAEHLVRAAAHAHGLGPAYEIVRSTVAAVNLFRAADSTDGITASIPVDIGPARLVVEARSGPGGRGMRLAAVPAPADEPFFELAEVGPPREPPEQPSAEEPPELDEPEETSPAAAETPAVRPVAFRIRGVPPTGDAAEIAARESGPAAIIPTDLSAYADDLSRDPLDLLAIGAGDAASRTPALVLPPGIALLICYDARLRLGVLIIMEGADLAGQDIVLNPLTGNIDCRQHDN